MHKSIHIYTSYIYINIYTAIMKAIVMCPMSVKQEGSIDGALK